jgi:RimJ/RimL family protein N-acetyltransferase
MPCYAREALPADVPRLTDGTVVLDAFRLTDAQSHLAGEDDELARRFGWFPRRSTLARARETIERWQAEWSNQGLTRCFATRLADGGERADRGERADGGERAESGELVGGCELRLRPDRTASMSYWTFPHHRRRGLASRAVRLAAEYAFACLDVTEIELYIEPDNAGSLGVARAAGFIAAGRGEQSPGSDAAPRTMLRFVLRRASPPQG